MKIKKYKNKIKVAIDSPAAAGAGTQAKLISKHYNLFYLDTGKIYRLIANIKLPQRSSSACDHLPDRKIDNDLSRSWRLWLR